MIVEISAVFASVALAALVVAAAYDVVHFEIPDTLSIIILVTALGHGAVMPEFHWASHLAAMLLVLMIGLLVFRLGAMGGADIKLLVAIAGWTGLAGLAQQITAVVVAGGGLALVLITVRAVAALAVAPELLPRIAQKGAPLPYAVAITAGTGWWAHGNWSVI
ncbi:MAG: prepilin peptidase [Sandarakinorhabdus sp.]|nr:prepilin peptidase [Sandarakinorhabdus sp.]